MIRPLIFGILHWASQSYPKCLRPISRPIYQWVTQFRVVRRIIWGVTSREKCHEYWSDPPDDLNQPLTYYLDGWESSGYLLNQLEGRVKNADKILEIGCNVGRNLYTFYNRGYSHLTGIELNPKAVALMAEKFPDMAENIVVINSPVEDVINQLPSNSFDIVYTMAVMEHIHEDSEWIFKEMVRISKRLIVTLEDEVAVSWRTFARNYQQVFEELGARQVSVDNCGALPEMYGSFKCRIFEVGR